MSDPDDVPLADGSDIGVTPNMIEAAKEDCPWITEHDSIMIYRTMARLDPELTALRAANAEMLEVLGNVSRMRMFPDDKINRMTLLAAIEIALAALNR